MWTISHEEKLFQAAEFVRNLVGLAWTTLFCSLVLIVLSSGIIDGGKELCEESKLFVFQYRVIRATFLALISLFLFTCWKWPRLKQWALRYRLVIWHVVGTFAIFNTSLSNIVLDFEFQSQSVDNCSPELQNALCPSSFWSVNGMSYRVSWIYIVNVLTRVPFKHLVILNVLHVIFLLVFAVLLGPLKGNTWGQHNSSGYSVVFSLTQCVVHTGLSLMLHYETEKERRSAFKKIRQVQFCKETTRTILQTMLPKRLIDASHKHMVPFPPLIVEEYPVVTVLFCQFDKSDILNFSSASEFLQLVAETIAAFDVAVKRHGVFKVEHIAEDYVVASSIVECGPSAAQLESLSTQKNMAKTIVDLALVLTKIGNSMTATSPDKPQNRLHFKGGVHTGPLVGAVAGKTRRFFRLFGDTVNTAARMCHHAATGTVQISEDTKKFMDNLHSLEMTEQEIVHIKGKGGMRTYTLNPLEGNRRDTSDGESSVLSSDVHLQPTLMVVGQNEPDFENEAVIKRDTLQAMFRRRSSPSTLAAFDSPQSLSFYESITVLGKTGRLSGSFHDKDQEMNFLQAKHETIGKESRKFLTAMTLMHAFYFTSIYSVVDFSSSVEAIRVGLVGFVLLIIHCGMFVHLRRCAICESRCHIKMSLITSCVGMLSVLAVCKSPFASFGIVQIVVLRPNHELPGVTLRILLPTIIIASAVLTFVQGIEAKHVINRLLPSFCMICIITVYQLSVARAGRATWFLDTEFNAQNEQLGTVLGDLLPSPTSRDFTRNRYLHIRAARDMDVDSSAAAGASHGEDVVPPSKSLFLMDDSSPVVVLCSDIVGFTPLCQKLTPTTVVKLLHDLWCIMDSAIISHVHAHEELLGPATKENPCKGRVKPFKVETIGDAYIIVSKLQDLTCLTQKSGICEMLALASEIMNAVHSYSMHKAPVSLNLDPGIVSLRMGLETGEAMCGVVGYLQPRYHVYGEVLRHATKLESQSSAGCIKVSSSMSQMFPEMCGNTTFCLIGSISSEHMHLDVKKDSTIAFGLDEDVSHRKLIPELPDDTSLCI